MKKKRAARRDIILAGDGGDPDECWNWEHYKNPGGYGQVWMNGRTRYVHRVSYEAHRGSIPDGMEIDHKCSNRACWNYRHLRVVTRAQNAQHIQLHPTNTSGYRGVSFDKRTGKWVAQVRRRDRNLFLGRYRTAEEAAAVAEAKRRELGFLGT